MTGRRITIPRGFKLKGSKLVKSDAHLPVNLRLQKQNSKRVRVAKRTAPRRD